MYIDESLANGLKERLFNELDDLGIKSGRLLSRYQRTHKKAKLGSRTSWKKLNQTWQIGFEHNILAVTKSGTRQNPLLLYAILGRNRLEEINDWKEKSFSIFYSSIDAWGNISEPSRVLVRIGEHAVTRVFQRHPEIYNSHTNDFEILKIISEFRSIAFFGQAMFLLFNRLAEDYEHFFENISVPFVSTNGIFLGNYNKRLNTCDVRTFIADHQLTPDQDALAKQIRALFDDDIFAGLPFVVQLSTNEIRPEFYIFLSQLNTVASQFAELVTWNEKNLVFKREFQQLIINHLNEYESYNQILKSHASE